MISDKASMIAKIWYAVPTIYTDTAAMGLA